MDEEPTESPTSDHTEHPPVVLDLLLITRAYNRREISLDDWLRQSREWAQAVIKQSQLPP